MNKECFFELIDGFEAVISAIVAQRDDAADLHQYLFPKFQRSLLGVRETFVMRNNIFQQLRAVNNLAADVFKTSDETGIVTCDIMGENMPFSHLRMSLLQSYLACNWSLYDNVSDLSGIDPLAKDTPSSEIFSFDRYCFMNTGKMAKHSVFIKLRDTYGAYLGLSYVLRNWVVHDGQYSAVTNGRLFETDTPVKGDSFTVSKESWSKIRGQVEDRYKTPVNKPDIPKDTPICLLKILNLLEQHNDQLFAHLIEYTGKLLRLNHMQMAAITT